VTDRRVDVFFYGLFMDLDLLRQRGLRPRDPRLARLDGYDIDVRGRATLVVDGAARVHGVVAGLTHQELGALYAEPSVREYRPEAVLVTLTDGRPVAALCYTRPGAGGPRDAAYAAKLLELAGRLGLPGDYLERLQQLAREEPMTPGGGPL